MSDLPKTELPTGTVTFLLTDVEGSTPLWQDAEQAMRVAAARHDALFEQAVQACGGVHIRPRGEGDSRFAVFSSASDAVAAAVAIQRALAAEIWPTPSPIKVRIGIHTGGAQLRDGDYYGSAVNRCARLRNLGHGDQTLLSEATAALARERLPAGSSLLDLGVHRLRGLSEPERVFQVVVPDLPRDFPALSSPDARPNNLPLQPTALLGREREVADVCALLRGDARLVTLTGPGGTGKTRLSLQVAAELLDASAGSVPAFEHGVFLVELAPITDPALVPSTVAQVLGIRDSGSRPIFDGLKEYVRNRSLLLVLDNFEQIVAAAPVVAELLAACAGLTVLVSSREPLQVRGEREYAVSPLQLPEAGRAPSAESLSQYGAASLFLQRAVAVKSDFAVTDENAPAIAEICRRLDGLPLAIELAAARVRLLTPQAILARLERRLPLLTGGARDLPARQQTLRNAIAWSYDLLSPEEQTLYRRLSIFVGGYTLEAAEAVCDPDGVLGLDVLDGITSLAARSLIRQVETPDGEPRFTMLETIREFGLEQLQAASEADVQRRRHAEHFATFVELTDPKLRTSEQATYFARVDADHDNLRTAMAWACHAGEAELALRLSAGLAWFWFVRGHFGEGRQWLDQALLIPATTDVSRARARALWGAGMIARNLGDYERALICHEESLALRRKLGDTVDIGVTLGALARVYRSLGDRQRSEALYEESLDVLRRTPSVWDLGMSLRNLGALVAESGHGELDRAEAILEEGLACYRQSGDRWAVASTLQQLARVAQQRDDLERATRLDEESLAISRSVGNRDGVATALRYLGSTALARGDTSQAVRAARESVLISLDIGTREEVIRAAELFGEVLAEQGDVRSAVRLLSASAAHREAIGIGWRSGERETVERYLAVTKSRLDEQAFGATRAEGRAMTLEQAVAYALGEPSPS